MDAKRAYHKIVGEGNESKDTKKGKNQIYRIDTKAQEVDIFANLQKPLEKTSHGLYKGKKNVVCTHDLFYVKSAQTKHTNRT